MIGKVVTGKSFLGCISYDLEDKQELTRQQKEQLSLEDGLQHNDRAEVLAYHKCFGNKYELAAQFIEVARLSKRVEKPVFHFSLRLAPGDRCTREELIAMGEACAKEFGIAGNQYLIVLHKDTHEPHIHIVANRVGYDGKVASDSNSYKRMAALCRRLEKEHQLTEVLSPRAFLPKEQRLIPRHDSRKEQLKSDIRRTLEQVTRYGEFENLMQKLGYTVLKGRGIAFIDSKKVRIKGSEVGFSLSKIEKILALKQELAVKQAEQEIYEIALRQRMEKVLPAHTPAERMRRQVWLDHQKEQSPLFLMEKQIKDMLDDLTKPEYTGQYVHPELLKEARRKKKRRKPKW